jgi:hypothetical protein
MNFAVNADDIGSDHDKPACLRRANSVHRIRADPLRISHARRPDANRKQLQMHRVQTKAVNHMSACEEMAMGLAFAPQRVPITARMAVDRKAPAITPAESCPLQCCIVRFRFFILNNFYFLKQK